MLGAEAYAMMLEEEILLEQLIHMEDLETQVNATFSSESSSHEDKKPDRKDVEVDAASSSLADAHSSSSQLLQHGSANIPAVQLDDFAHHHHLTRTQVEGLLMVLGPHYSNPGRRAPLKDFVITSLVVLSTKNNYRELNESKLFKSRGWMHKTLHQFCRMMVEHLSEIIEWPTNNCAQDSMNEFESIVGLPGVMGAMDTCHMPITKAPVGKNSRIYSNPMLFHSIHLLAVADAKSKFTYINVGRPGSFRENKVFRLSSLNSMIEIDSASLFPPNSHIIADSAFPLSDFIITPYPVSVNTTRDQKNFNSKLYATRRPVEFAFELLRQRWKRLKCLEMDEVKSMISLVKTCCILHNICINNEEYSQWNYDPEDKEDVEVEYVGVQSLSALQKRDMLSMYMNGQTLTLNIQ